MANHSRDISPDERGRRHLKRAKEAAARFTVRHMNDTKWREVFTVFHGFCGTIRRVQLKFIDRADSLPSSGQFSLGHIACDGFPGPFLYRELEWLDVPEHYEVRRGSPGTPALACVQELGPLRAKLAILGMLPIRDVPGGFRIVGYE